MFHSAYQKVLPIMGRGRDGPTNSKEPEYEYGSVPKHLREVSLVKKDEYLIRNGAYIFEELVKSTHGKNNPFRIFSLKELQKATNNFSANMDSFPLTYRGVIEDRHVAVKFSNIREIVILSLIKHRNVVKLLGCCLETKVPIVVHELPPNGTLREYIFPEKLIPPPVEVLWTDRLRIASEIADALSYLHSALHITHGGLSYFAVLLDEFHSAKLGAFDFSQIQNQAERSDVVTENRNKLRKREDVYDFGKILLNLLGVYAPFDKEEMLKYLKLNVSEKEMPQIDAYIDLLLRCRDREDEPSIEEVARELRFFNMMNHRPTTDGNESDDLSSGANYCLLIKQ